VIQESEVLAVQLHCRPDVVTLTERVTPGLGSEGTLTVVRLSVNTQLVACCTENLCPAIVSDPLLTLNGLDSTEKATEPLPVPLDPDVIEIHESLLAAVHAHPGGAETVTVAVGPGPTSALA
jgi:hypothetical protein